MNNLSFKIMPSLESNDHETRILIDNEDFLGIDYLGIDPPSFFSQENFDKNGELLIGRCDCGVEGCCDYPVTITVYENTISWTDDNGLNLNFDKSEYGKIISKAKDDYSWEDIKRKVERLTTEILKYSQTKDNYHFNWASARISDNQITLSYNKDSEQKLFYLNWDGQTEKGVKKNAEEFLKERLKEE